MLVALDVKHYSEGAVATAAKVAARRRRGIHVLVTIPVPGIVADHAEMPEQELAAQAIIEQARIQGGRRVSGHYEKVRARPGRAHDRQRGARRCSAQAVVMPLPRADRRLAVRQDGRDRARRAPVPGHHPLRRRASGEAAPRRAEAIAAAAAQATDGARGPRCPPPRDAAPVRRDARDRRGADRARAGGRRRRARRRRRVRHAVRRRRARAAVGWRGATGDVPAHARRSPSSSRSSTRSSRRRCTSRSGSSPSARSA